MYVIWFVSKQLARITSPFILSQFQLEIFYYAAFTFHTRSTGGKRCGVVLEPVSHQTEMTRVPNMKVYYIITLK